MKGLGLPLVLVLSASSASATDWPMYGFDVSQSRFNSDEKGIDASNVAGLQQLWFKATGGAVSATPAVVGGIVYVGSWDHNFYALDAHTGAENWKVMLATPQGDKAGFPGI